MSEKSEFESASEEIGIKVKAMREAEGMKQTAASKATDIPYSTWRAIEDGQVPRYEHLRNMLNYPAFRKYTLWLMTNETCPHIGQVSPAEFKTKNYASSVLDLELLETIMDAVDTALSQQEIELSADRKSKIIGLLYSQLWLEEQPEIDLSNVVQLIKVAA